jgi:hypothetical protein
MATPQTYKKKLNILGAPQGIKRREQIKEMITDKDTNLPKGVLHADLDAGFKRFVEHDLEVVLDRPQPDGGSLKVKTPVIMMGIQAWNEYSKTWEFTDKYKNIQIPFITIIRNPDAQVGTHPGIIHNIPQGRKFIYAEVPTWDGNRKGMDLYKINQPVPVDIEYNVRLFAFRQRDLNEFNKIALEKFQALQAYTEVNGHYIPITLTDISDESEIKDLKGKRFYIQLYKFLLQGFIIDPKEFEITPMISRVFQITELQKKC